MVIKMLQHCHIFQHAGGRVKWNADVWSPRFGESSSTHFGTDAATWLDQWLSWAFPLMYAHAGRLWTVLDHLRLVFQMFTCLNFAHLDVLMSMIYHKQFGAISLRWMFVLVAFHPQVEGPLCGGRSWRLRWYLATKLRWSRWWPGRSRGRFWSGWLSKLQLSTSSKHMLKPAWSHSLVLLSRALAYPVGCWFVGQQKADLVTWQVLAQSILARHDKHRCQKVVPRTEQY